jgi:4-amino-4-deoxy-L-arabinose transferase-like glycosyltransferase
MSAEPTSDAAVPTADPVGSRPMGLEVALVTLLSLALLVPGIQGYSLVDPWETHYGEVARRMLQDSDWVHTDWQNEGFRSKPVLTFWLMAASMRVFGIAENGGYSGEMVDSPLVMLAIRLPFVLFGVLGLVTTWWMLARLVGRRVAYLAFIAIGSCPFFALVARQGITDMTLVGCMMGAVAMFALATEAGEERIPPLGQIAGRTLDGRHVFFLVIGGLCLWQAAYYVLYFLAKPQLAGLRFPAPGFVLAGFIGLGLAAQSATLWRWVFGPVADIVSFPARVLIAAVYAAMGEPDAWKRAGAEAPATALLQPITTRRQVYFLWFYALLGISVLGKGLPALGLVGVICLFYVLLLRRWRDVIGAYEIKRGIAIIAIIAVPWHVAMWLKDGRRFLNEYFVLHLFNRAAVGVFGERGTFEFYLAELGNGMWLWAALLPAAVAAAVTANGIGTRKGRVRMIVAIWAITSVAFFSLVQTKFHHYILPAVPALAMLVAFWLDEVLAGRARTSLVLSLLGVGIVLLLTRDFMHEEKQWIEMFVFRYDRPWPSAPPWQIDATDGFLGLGLFAAAAVLILGIPRLARLGVALVCTAGLAIGLWSMHVYMPEAGTHWGMRQTIRTYYEQRQIYGHTLVYYGARQLADDWAGVTDRWTFETFVPDHLQVGQPMTISIEVRSVDDRTTEREFALVGPVVAIGDHSVTVQLAPADVEALRPSIAAGKQGRRATRRPVRIVDADRLFAWQLYWRGENFWSGDEIWGPLPELKTALKETDNIEFLKYLNNPQVARHGRRYFVATEAGRVNNLRAVLPTATGRETFEVLDTTSNKFTLAAFVL